MLTKHAKNIPGQFKKIAHKLSDWFKCMHFTSADRLISLLQTTKLCGHLKRVVTIFCVSFEGVLGNRAEMRKVFCCWPKADRH